MVLGCVVLWADKILTDRATPYVMPYVPLLFATFASPYRPVSVSGRHASSTCVHNLVVRVSPTRPSISLSPLWFSSPQVFNEVNARHIGNDCDVFSGLHANPLFVGILLFTLAAQVVRGWAGCCVVCGVWCVV